MAANETAKGEQAAADFTLAELCIAAAARAWADDGELLASGLGTAPRLAAGLAWLTLNPELMMTDSECMLVGEPVPPGPRGDYRPKVEGWLPFRAIFDLIAGGRRHAMTMPTQIDRYGGTNISVIGDYDHPKVALLGVRGIPGNTINHPCSFFIPSHSTRSFVESVDMLSGVSYDPSRWPAGARREFHDYRLVVSNLAVLDFGGTDDQGARTMRLVSTHPGVSVEQVQEATGFELALADNIVETPAPTAEQLAVLRDRLDPHNLRATVFPPAKSSAAKKG
jgi:glutaconate CoA-transferase subunit B